MIDRWATTGNRIWGGSGAVHKDHKDGSVTQMGSSASQHAAFSSFFNIQTERKPRIVFLIIKKKSVLRPRMHFQYLPFTVLESQETEMEAKLSEALSLNWGVGGCKAIPLTVQLPSGFGCQGFPGELLVVCSSRSWPILWLWEGCSLWLTPLPSECRSSVASWKVDTRRSLCYCQANSPVSSWMSEHLAVPNSSTWFMRISATSVPEHQSCWQVSVHFFACVKVRVNFSPSRWSQKNHSFMFWEFLQKAHER